MDWWAGAGVQHCSTAACEQTNAAVNIISPHTCEEETTPHHPGSHHSAAQHLHLYHHHHHHHLHQLVWTTIDTSDTGGHMF